VSAKPILKPGTRVIIRDGRHGTVIKHLGPHNGYRIRLDEKKNALELDHVRIQAYAFTLEEETARAAFEARWPSFVRRDRARWLP